MRAERVPTGPARLAATGPAVRAWLTNALIGAQGGLVALAVGESTLPLYGSLLGYDPAWDGVRILPVDELVPPPADPSASFGARLAGALPRSLACRIIPIDVASGREEAARALSDLIHHEGLRAVLLGLGPDGHIAFNQPGSEPADGARAVRLLPGNLARLGDVAPAEAAVTIGIAEILGAARVGLVATGPGKSGALHRVLHGPEGPDCPASFLRRHPALTVFCDDGAPVPPDGPAWI